MANPHVSTLKYRLTTWTLFPLAFAHTAFTALKHKNLTYLFQRFACYGKSKRLPTQPIWCHCASVGEINTALPLLRALIDQGESLLITTNTPTGYETLSRANLNNSVYVYLPLDYSLLATRLIHQYQPKHCLVFETELWPNILLTIIRNKIKLVIVNGRISKKTLKAPKFILSNYQRILSNAQHIICSSKENSASFISLGADAKKISILDNLKFTNINLCNSKNYTAPLAFPYLLCASTHEGEEESILKAWSKSSANSMGLVIALRHPKRVIEVIRILEKLNLSYVLHSSNVNSAQADSIYIIDTIGELMPFIAHAKIVFMGGSLEPIGGHNMIEPAQYKRCILIGPYHHDFKNIVDDLIEVQGIQIINSAEQLIEKAIQYYSSEKQCAQMGENAYRYLQSKQQVLAAYEKSVLQLIKN